MIFQENRSPTNENTAKRGQSWPFNPAKPPKVSTDDDAVAPRTPPRPQTRGGRHKRSPFWVHTRTYTSMQTEPSDIQQETKTNNKVKRSTTMAQRLKPPGDGGCRCYVLFGWFPDFVQASVSASVHQTARFMPRAYLVRTRKGGGKPKPKRAKSYTEREASEKRQETKTKQTTNNPPEWPGGCSRRAIGVERFAGLRCLSLVRGLRSSFCVD